MKEIFDDRPIEMMDGDGDNLVFHYEKGSFSRHENSKVRELATKGVQNPGFFKVLVSTKSNRFVFFAMLICVGVSVFLGFFRKEDTDIIGGVRCSVSAISFRENVYATFEMTDSSKKTDDLPVVLDVALECINSDDAVADRYTEVVTFIPGKKQNLDVSFPDYEIRKIRAVVKCGESEKMLTARIISRSAD